MNTFQSNFKPIAIDLSKQIKLENLDLKQQIILLVNLKKIKQQCFSSLKNQKKQLLNFHNIL